MRSWRTAGGRAKISPLRNVFSTWHAWPGEATSGQIRAKARLAKSPSWPEEATSGHFRARARLAKSPSWPEEATKVDRLELVYELDI
jgi:hypothetical protein